MLRYLRLTRAHTVPLEAVPAIIGASLAAGTVWSIDVALWGVFGVLYHLAGYGHNSVADWSNGYDKNDPNKQHHPLNSGDISYTSAKWIVKLLLVATGVYALILTWGNITAISGVALAVIAGMLYNIVGKQTQFKFIYISIAHTMTFIVPYLALNGNTNSLVFQLGVVYVFLWVVFQISVSGEIKDIAQDESNFLKKLGASAYEQQVDSEKYFVEFSRYVKHYAYSIKLLNVLTAVVIAAFFSSTPILFALLVTLILIQANVVIKMLRNGCFFRQLRVRQMSTVEMLSLMIFVVAFLPALGTSAVVALIGGSIIWVVAGNVALWGTLVGPKV